jgi:O-antigen ligase
MAARLPWVAAAIAICAVLGASLLQQPGWGPLLAILSLLVLALARPFEALLVFTAVVPLTTIVLVLSGGDPSFRLAEGLALALLAGWTLRRGIQAGSLAISPWLLWAALSFVVAVLASAVVSGAVLLVEDPGISLADLGAQHLYSLSPVNGAVFLAGSVLLLLATVDICAREPRRHDEILRMLVTAAAAAALLNILRFVFVALRSSEPWSAFLGLLIQHRVNVHHGDLNAAGSYFAMMLLVAASLAGRAPVLAALSSPLIATALWATGSRTAMAAALLAAVALGLGALRRGDRRVRRPILIALILAPLLVAGVATFYPAARNAAGLWSLSTRVELGRAALQMAASEPVFGVGVGHYYLLSHRYAGDMLAAQGKVQENAHNYFLQVLAELGLPGFILFAGVFLIALYHASRAPGPPGPAWGVLAGIGAFLATAAAGHPFLVSLAAYPFWILLGLAGSAAPAQSPMRRTARVAAFAVLLFFAVTLPFRMVAAVQQAEREHLVTGLSPWQHAEGSRYRIAEAHASFYIHASPRVVRIPVRHAGRGPEPLEVRVLLDGRLVDVVQVFPAAGWQEIRLVLPRPPAGRFVHLELQTNGADADVPTPTSGALRVGRPVYQW